MKKGIGGMTHGNSKQEIRPSIKVGSECTKARVLLMVFSSHVWTVELVIFFFWDVLTAVTKDKALERRRSQ